MVTLPSTNLADITVNQVPRAIDITVIHPGPGRTWQLQMLAHNPLPFNGPTLQVTHQRPKLPPPRRSPTVVTVVPQIGSDSMAASSAHSQNPSPSIDPPTGQLTRDQSTHLPGDHLEFNCGSADWLGSLPLQPLRQPVNGCHQAPHRWSYWGSKPLKGRL